MNRALVHGAINRLVEAREDQHDLRTQLTEFRQTRIPPSIPDQFDTMQEFLDYDEAKRDYENELRGLETRLANAKKAYDQAGYTVKGALPPNRRLTYEYEGDRQEFTGMRFVLMNQNLSGGKGTLLVSSSRPATERDS